MRFPIFALLLTLTFVFLTGCATHRIDVVSFDNGTRFRLVNRSGFDLHDLRTKTYVELDSIINILEDTVGTFEKEQSFDCDHRFPKGMVQIQLYGHCKEGRVRGSWYGVEKAD